MAEEARRETCPQTCPQTSRFGGYPAVPKRTEMPDRYWDAAASARIIIRVSGVRVPPPASVESASFSGVFVVPGRIDRFALASSAR